MELKILVLYVPVIHAGYLKIFKKYTNEVSCLYILGKDLIKEFTYLEEEIRAVEPETMVRLVESLRLFRSVELLDHSTLSELTGSKLITAKEGLMERFVDKYFPFADVTYDTVFLRWDETHVTSKKPVVYDRISDAPFDMEVATCALHEGQKTSDWWRSVGAIAVKDGRVLFRSHNTHVPSEHSPYVHGDIRDFVEAGKHSDVTSALHAEKGIIVEAARHVLEGTSIYVSVFPCPDCAKLLAYSGIKCLYYSSGHASFDGQKILHEKGVEIVFVPLVL